MTSDVSIDTQEQKNKQTSKQATKQTHNKQQYASSLVWTAKSQTMEVDTFGEEYETSLPGFEAQISGMPVIAGGFVADESTLVFSLVCL